MNFITSLMASSTVCMNGQELGMTVQFWTPVIDAVKPAEIVTTTIDKTNGDQSKPAETMTYVNS